MSKEEMIACIEIIIRQMYYEDVEFFYNMMCRFMEKKSCKKKEK